MTLGSTQTLTGIFLGGKGWPGIRLTIPPPSVSPLSRKMWEPRRLTILWASTACYRDSFTFYVYCFHQRCYVTLRKSLRFSWTYVCCYLNFQINRCLRNLYLHLIDLTDIAPLSLFCICAGSVISRWLFRTIFGQKRDKIRGGCRICILRNFVIRNEISRICSGGEEVVYRILVRRPERKRPLGGPRLT
jgi:hypothetical protein